VTVAGYRSRRPGSVWTGDPERHEDRQARAGGDVRVNLYVPDIGAPWGGRKASGMGSIYGPEGLDSYLATRCVFLPS
jgi:aldehyde dehydrogenase (NAD+)